MGSNKIRLERDGVESCIKKITEAIKELDGAAKTVERTMNELPQYWEGSAYDKARETYEADYRTLLTKTVPEAVEKFNEYIQQCEKKIIEIDTMLAGGTS